MGFPIQRTYQFQGAAPALNVTVFMADLQTLQNNFLVLTNNQIQDLVSNPPLAATQLYEFNLVKNGNATAVRTFSSAINPNTSGRVSIGNVNMSSGNYQWSVKQTAGVLANPQILVRYASPLN
tara:strand:+ start:283 stop:651 length:369 start_codon:yes stop_codon:yes gene_type:complete